MADSPFVIDLNEKFRQLSRPPIVEATIHWQARAQNPLEEERLSTLLTEKLPLYSQEPMQQTEWMALLPLEAAAPFVQHKRGWQGVRLKSPDGRFVIQFTKDGLVFSQTQSYQSWTAFTDVAKEAWRVFVEMAAPIETQRLGVRFINHLAEAIPVNLHEYLREPPTCPSNLPLKDFVYQSTFALPSDPFGVRIIKVMQPSMPELKQSSGLFLDIDVFSTIAIPNEAEALDEALKKMRWLKNKAFFTLLTEKALQTFQ